MKGTLRKNARTEAFDLTKPVFNLEEAAAFLQLSTKNVRERAEKGEIPAIRVGQSWRFLRQKLEEMFSRST